MCKNDNQTQEMDELLTNRAAETGKTRKEIIREFLSRYSYISRRKRNSNGEAGERELFYFPGQHEDHQELTHNGLWRILYDTEGNGYIAVQINEEKKGNFSIRYMGNGSMVVPLGELVYLLDEASISAGESGADREIGHDAEKYLETFVVTELQKLGIDEATALLVLSCLQAGHYDGTPIDGSP